jgi:hypothetical protein
MDNRFLNALGGQCGLGGGGVFLAPVAALGLFLAYRVQPSLQQALRTSLKNCIIRLGSRSTVSWAGTVPISVSVP